ncbi:hypothetical protein HPP92_006075 [Vanilla planifolia]|uniref:Uncharacterized protein n=1 Tax=Vanilla planifolia TaxID=51239 RepID=A0A835RMW9_VANPL|nr:hypothetical protein HPP92_006075 [Vanilla planifolia]
MIPFLDGISDVDVSTELAESPSLSSLSLLLLPSTPAPLLRWSWLPLLPLVLEESSCSGPAAALFRRIHLQPGELGCIRTLVAPVAADIHIGNPFVIRVVLAQQVHIKTTNIQHLWRRPFVVRRYASRLTSSLNALASRGVEYDWEELSSFF